MNILLSIVSTPIGHLDDLSKRALETLSSCDAILCEDTRRTSILLDRYGIRKPLTAYHKFTEKQLLEKILGELEAGRHLALVSDAGTPCINDPGQILVDACRLRKIPYTAIPGPCSLVQALVLSGFDTARFQFIGFLPKKGSEALQCALSYPGVTIAFESPERLVSTLEDICAADPDRDTAVAREMTKTFEECRRDKASALLEHFRAHPPKGEIVLLVGEGSPPDDLSPEELIQMLVDYHGLSLKEAVKQAAKLKNMPKRTLYNQIHKS